MESIPFFREASQWELPLDSEVILEIALYASGLTETEMVPYRRKVLQDLETFRNEQLPIWEGLNDYEKGEALLLWLHDKYLISYHTQQTLIHVLLDQGSYNCVSSSVLFLIFAAESGLQASGVETKDHAFCIIQTDQGPIDVETTNIYGFDPGSKKEFQDKFNRTGFNYVPPGNYRDRWDRSSRDICGLILQNRMAMNQRRNLHEETVGLGVDYWTLCPTDRTMQELNNVMRNWAAEMNRRNYYREGFLFMLLVQDRFPPLPDNEDILYSLAYNYLVELTNEEQFSQARQFLPDYGEALPGEKQLDLEKLILEQELEEMIKTAPYEESLAAVRKAMADGMLRQRLYQQWIAVLHQNQAITIADNQHWLEAWEFLQALPEEDRQLSALVSMIRQMQHNWTVSVHNNFIELFQSQQFDQALEILEQGLLVDPSNRTLLSDRTRLQQQMEANR